jgi:hypothetical protein
MSRHQMADKILFEDLRRYYKLKELTSNTVVLGQFVELRLMAWLKEHVIHRLYQGHSLYLGTGTIHVPKTEPDRRGQCDIVLYEALPKKVEFRQDDLVVVGPEAVWGIIETKSALTSQERLENALRQVRQFKNMAPAALVYLFARDSISADTLIEHLEDLSLRGSPIQALPDAIILVEQQCAITIDHNERKTERSVLVSKNEPRDLKDRLQHLSEEKGVPYDELIRMPMGYIRDTYDLSNRYGLHQLFSSFSETFGASPVVVTSLTAKELIDISGYRQTVSSFLGKLIGDLEGKAVEIEMSSN